jgi:hypothetical protein
MYSSLDRIDITARDPATGHTLYHQTDHREAAEIEAEPEVSVLFALTRVLNAVRAGRPQGASVAYVCLGSPSPLLAQAVASAGGELRRYDGPVPFSGETAPPDDLADAAFRELAERVRARVGGSLDAELLQRLEAEVLAAGTTREEDEIGWWTRVIELAAVAGELLRAQTQGRWGLSRKPLAVVPFSFICGSTEINPCGKAEKLLEHGPSESLSSLLLAAQDLGRELTAGPLLVNFKAASWEGRTQSVCRPLLEGAERQGVGVPLAVLGYDHPNTFGNMSRLPEGATFDELFTRAIDNLAGIDVPVEKMQVEDLVLLIAHDHFFACEKLLDAAFMKRCQDQLGAELLAAGLPNKGLLLLTGAAQPPAILHKFAAICEGRHRAAPEPLRLSPVPLLVQDGKVLGFLTRGDEPPPADPAGPARRRGFFSRLLGRA